MYTDPTGKHPRRSRLGCVRARKNLALVRRLETRLSEIDSALRAAKKGTYGLCGRCGQPIDPARLRALPEATLCIKCKNLLEKQARRATL
ncbi:MAG: TraR/DksA C4-type zinc finger protein [Chloroflexi bacterium]|nr:TraR/DksA C4-type zinc finger protein [Chloroflexota bacterium]